MNWRDGESSDITTKNISIFHKENIRISNPKQSTSFISIDHKKILSQKRLESIKMHAREIQQNRKY